MNTVHIVFGDSAAENVTSALRKSNQHKSEKVICMKEDFSIGPISKLECDEGIQVRKKWLGEVLKTIDPHFIKDSDDFEWIAETMRSNLQSVTEIPNDSKIVLWHGSNTSDKIGLMFVAFLLQDKNVYFEEVNVTEYSHHINYMIRDMHGEEIPHMLNSVGATPPKLILDVLQMKKSMSNIEVQMLIKNWEKWSGAKEILRILLNEEVVAVSEDYYDTAILQTVSNEYEVAARVVGEVMGTNEQCIGDTYLAFRVHYLIQKGQLQYKGDLGGLGKFGIRLG
ncbi:hypothetical protein BAMA_13660 [Bacillus manliponensis]|uniref:DUF1835 domain-containing protein n=1 Tax=Bacillus manliponensis TaxID=574376 RepID=A0A073KDV5_9BACI|nr:DUF1835 domain-containing protein [Bacillus manliponensis]KEK20463.1 hypothetical protein BAMA_13660 [Bacillus manliponensis]